MPKMLCYPLGFERMRLRHSSHHNEALVRMKELGLWNGSFNGRESTLQQLAPYIGKLKSGIVRSLIRHFTKPGDWILDPFSGSGVVPLEALLLGRRAAATDLSIYGYCLTRGKAESPADIDDAVARTGRMLRYVERHKSDFDLRSVSEWVRSFFHPKTLREILAAYEFCHAKKDYFLAACLSGILHHQRPGFLSYPASHMVPYLRTQLFPREVFPHLYEYRPLAERITKKIHRAYRRSLIVKKWNRDSYDIRLADARRLPFECNSMDFVLTSPPYYKALDYARDNRLRLWFLGEPDWHKLEERLTTRVGTYESEMKQCLAEISRVLKPGSYCAMVVGEVRKNGKTRDTGTILGLSAHEASGGDLTLDSMLEDEIPAVRRSRRGTSTTRTEKLLVFRKTLNSTAKIISHA